MMTGLGYEEFERDLAKLAIVYIIYRHIQIFFNLTTRRCCAPNAIRSRQWSP